MRHWITQDTKLKLEETNEDANLKDFCILGYDPLVIVCKNV